MVFMVEHIIIKRIKIIVQKNTSCQLNLNSFHSKLQTFRRILTTKKRI